MINTESETWRDIEQHCEEVRETALRVASTHGVDTARTEFNRGIILAMSAILDLPTSQQKQAPRSGAIGVIK